MFYGCPIGLTGGRFLKMTGLKEKIELDMDCANCGQPAVAGSRLCVDCLVSCTVRIANDNVRLQTQMELNEESTIELLEKKESELICLRVQLKLTRRVMRHVFAEYQKLQKLQGVNGGEEG